ncbi:MAG: O-antigen ligase family protein [Anaerolineae bacterium]
MTQTRSRTRHQLAAKSPEPSTPVARLCDALIEAGLLIAIIVAPLYFNPRTEHTFEPDKAALLRSVMLIAFLAWLIKRRGERGKGKEERGKGKMENGLPSSPFRSPFSIPSTRLTTGLQSPISNLQSPAPLVLPTLLLLTAYLISTASSVLPRVSLWGSYERGQGLYTLTTYIVLFFLVREILSTSVGRQRLLDAILFVSLPISVYAVLQHFGLDPLTFQTGGAAVTLRAIGTLGNPIFLGAYLAMVIPVTVLCAYQAWQRMPDGRASPGMAGMYGVLLLFQLAAFFFAQSRGPALGLVAGLGYGVIMWAARGWGRRGVAVGAAVILFGMIVIGLLPALAPETAGLGRLGQLIAPTSRTGQQRLLAWEGAVSLATAQPARMWVGFGPETFRDTVGAYLPDRMAALKPDEDFDRAHNAVLDLWATAGLLGVAAYLLMIGAVLYYGLRTLGLVPGPTDRWRFLALALAGSLLGGLAPWWGIGRQWIGVGLPLGLLGGVGAFVVWQGLSADRQRGELTGDELLVVALLAAVVGHVVETLVGIAIVSTYTLFWIYAALIAGLATKAQGPGATETARARSSRRSRPRSPAPLFPGSAWGIITGVVLALFGYSLLSVGEGRAGLAWGVVASLTLIYGVWYLMVSRPSASDTLNRYLGISVGAVLILLLLTWLPGPPFDITHRTVAVFAFVIIAVLALSVSLAGLDRVREAYRAASRGRWSLYGLLGVAVLAAIWVSNVNPIRADVYYKQGLGLSAAGDLDNAARAFEASVALNLREDRYQSGMGAAYAQMAQATDAPALRDKRLTQAEAHLQAAQRLDPFRADHLRNLGVLHRLWASFSPPEERVPRLHQALTDYEQATARNPISVRNWREWGEVYAALGEWEAAVQHYDESLRLNDSFVETWLLLAEAQLHRADYAGARQAYTRALALDETRTLKQRRAAAANSPDDPLPHQALALVYAALGDSQTATAEADAARRLMAEEPADWPRFLQAIRPR